MVNAHTRSIFFIGGFVLRALGLLRLCLRFFLGFRLFSFLFLHIVSRILAIVGGVEAGPFEDNSYRQKYLAQLVFAALGTLLKWRIVESLTALDLHPAVFATIRIQWH